MGRSCNNRVDPVKVVIINTQYVDTDAVSFKSVVQRLTGKDAMVAAEETFQSKSVIKNTNMERTVTTNEHKPVLLRGMSFRDFDGMLKELTPLDELYNTLYADY